MSEYLHGAYGKTSAEIIRKAQESEIAMVLVSVFPVQTTVGGAGRVNTPVVVRSMSEAKSLFGYSDDWATYPGCMAFKHFFEDKAVGPLVVINVLDPATHKGGSATTKSMTVTDGVATLAEAETAVLDSLTVKTGSGDSAQTKTLGTDYSATYDPEKKIITIQALEDGALGTGTISVTYNTVTPASVTDAAIIGTTDDMGLNTGIYAIEDVYTKTGLIPEYLICPGFSSHKAVHAAMTQKSKKINGHWDAWIFTDLPLEDNGTALTLATAATWKKGNGFTAANETTHYPIATGTDGKNYYLSVLRAATHLQQMNENGGLPYQTASNKGEGLIANLYTGEDSNSRLLNDQIINKYLNKHGIASAAYVAGRWTIWGAHSADYDEDNATQINVAETNMMMLYHISNDFQARRALDVDRTLTWNDIQTIAAEEQVRLTSLVSMGALSYGEVELKVDADTRSDLMMGEYVFSFKVTTVPLAKALTADVKWVADGFEVFFRAAMEDA